MFGPEFSLYLLFIILPAIWLSLWFHERNKKKLEEQKGHITRDELDQDTSGRQRSRQRYPLSTELDWIEKKTKGYIIEVAS